MEITCLGTGYAQATAERDNTYLLLQNDNKNRAVMIDIGGSPLSKLKKNHVNVNAIQSVIITHFHIDHIYGLPSLLWGMWLSGRKEELTIYCSHENKPKLKAWLTVLEIEKWPAEFPISINTFATDKMETLFLFGEATISSFPAKHVVPTVGIEIKTDSRLLVYSGDTEPNKWIQDYEKIDVLYHECTFSYGQHRHHTSLEQFISFYDLNKIGKVLLVHLSDKEDYQSALNTFAAKKERVKIQFATE